MKVLLKIIFIFLLFPIKTFAFENPKVKINNFFIQKYEVTIAEFSNFANKTNFKIVKKNLPKFSSSIKSYVQGYKLLEAIYYMYSV